MCLLLFAKIKTTPQLLLQRLNKACASPGEDVDAEHVCDDGDHAEDGHGDALHPEGAGLDRVKVLEVEVAAVVVGEEGGVRGLQRDRHLLMFRYTIVVHKTIIHCTYMNMYYGPFVPIQESLLCTMRI